ncbi:unnamed protein product [Closterium sp. NIES-65]|nr:unnamed protein product [Closterium sp. NIES-65]
MSALGLSAAAPASARLSVSAEPAHLRLRGGRTIPSAWKPTPLLLTSSRSAAASRRASLPIRASAAAGAEGAAGDAAGSAAQGGMTYKDAGVDIDAGAELVRRIAKMTPGIGGFGGLYPFGDHYLVAGTDGVGTKLKLAFAMDKHDTIGIDLVAMSVNDIITSGARPLFFLDYFASSKLEVDQAEQVIKGIVDGCKQSDCVLLGGEVRGRCRRGGRVWGVRVGVVALLALLPVGEVRLGQVGEGKGGWGEVRGRCRRGGRVWGVRVGGREGGVIISWQVLLPLEGTPLSAWQGGDVRGTAEMPGFYADKEYDLSGFAVGAVKKAELIDGSGIRKGDKIIESFNALSLLSPLRPYLFAPSRVVDASGASLSDPLPGAPAGVTIGGALLEPTVIYVRQVLDIIKGGGVHGIAHITGGGFTENIPRIFPEGLAAKADMTAWEEPPIFKWLRKAGNIAEDEMRRVFNLGIGMVLIVDAEASKRIIESNPSAVLVGEVVEGEGVIFS